MYMSDTTWPLMFYISTLKIQSFLVGKQTIGFVKDRKRQPPGLYIIIYSISVEPGSYKCQLWWRQTHGIVVFAHVTALNVVVFFHAHIQDLRGVYIFIKSLCMRNVFNISIVIHHPAPSMIFYFLTIRKNDIPLQHREITSNLHSGQYICFSF
jgi:hypothetical protein